MKESIYSIMYPHSRSAWLTLALLVWLSRTTLAASTTPTPAGADPFRQSSAAVVSQVNAASDVTRFKAWLNEDAPDPDQWKEILQSFGSSFQRNSLRDLILNREPFPAEIFVPFLQDPQLNVRLAALELLEEYAGTAFNYDPWLPTTTPANTEALHRWQTWLNNQSENSETNAPIYSGLTSREIQLYIQEALNETRPQRQARAVRILSSGDLGVADELQGYLQAHPNLPLADQHQIKTICYRILIPPSLYIDEVKLAQDLVSGDADARITACGKLVIAGPGAVPILQSGLKDDNPIVREAAAEAIIDAGGKHVIPVIEAHLKEETDYDVVYAIIRALGKIRTKNSLELLTGYFRHDQEDLVLIAIQSATKLKTHRVSKALIPCLQDPRWRVRAAALNAAEELEDKVLAEPIKQCLSDEDSFVRYAAVRALPQVTDEKDCINLLEEMFLEQEELRIPAVKALTVLDRPFPTKLQDTLLSLPVETQVAIAGILAEDSSKYRNVLILLARSEHDDVACIALRGLARHVGTSHLVIGALVHGLSSSSVARQQAVLRYFKPNDKLAESIQHTTRRFSDASEPSSEKLATLFEAFLHPEAAASRSSSSHKTDADVITAFFSGQRKAPSEEPSSLDDLILAIEACKTNAHTETARMAHIASLAIMPSQNFATLTNADLSSYSMIEQRQIIRALDSAKNKEALPFLKRLLASPDSTVKKEATEAMFSDSFSSKGLETVLQMIAQQDSPLHPADISQYYFLRKLNRHRRTARTWARDTWASTNEVSTPARILATMILGSHGRHSDAPLVVSLCENTNEFIRATAWYALASLDHSTFDESLETALHDPSEIVRLAVLSAIAPQSQRILHYAKDREQTITNDDFIMQKRSRSKREALLKNLKVLENDPSPRIRLHALVVRLSLNDDISPVQIYHALKDIPSASQSDAEFITAVLTDRIAILDADYAQLLPVLENMNAREYRISNLQEAFEKKQRSVTEPRISRSVLAYHERANQEPTPVNTSAPSSELKVILFVTPECEECFVVKDWIREWTDEFPAVIIDEYSILEKTGQRLQERYIDALSSDPAQEGITPFIVTAAGHLERNQLFDPTALHEMLLSAQYLNDTNWILTVSEKTETAQPPAPTKTPIPPSQDTEAQPEQSRTHLYIIGLAVLASAIFLTARKRFN